MKVSRLGFRANYGTTPTYGGRFLVALPKAEDGNLQAIDLWRRPPLSRYADIAHLWLSISGGHPVSSVLKWNASLFSYAALDGLTCVTARYADLFARAFIQPLSLDHYFL